MFDPVTVNANGNIRHNEMVEAAKKHRRAKKFSKGISFRLPKLSNLFAGRQPEGEAAVPVQTQ